MTCDLTVCRQFEIPALASKGKTVRDLVGRFCRQIALLESQIEGLQLAVSEAFNNAVEHGLKFNKAETVTLVFKVHSHKLTIAVEDHGSGIDFKKLSYVGALLNLSERGRGFQIMNALIDGVEVERLNPYGTRLSLVKWIPA